MLIPVIGAEVDLDYEERQVLADENCRHQGLRKGDDFDVRLESRKDRERHLLGVICVRAQGAKELSEGRRASRERPGRTVGLLSPGDLDSTKPARSRRQVATDVAADVKFVNGERAA